MWRKRTADKPELKESSSSLLSSRHSNNPTPSGSGNGSRSTTPTPGNPNPEDVVKAAPPVVRSGMLKIRVTAGKGFSLPQGGEWASDSPHAFSSEFGEDYSASPMMTSLFLPFARHQLTRQSPSRNLSSEPSRPTPPRPSHHPSPPPLASTSAPSPPETATRSNANNSGGFPTSSLNSTRTRSWSTPSEETSAALYGCTRRRSMSVVSQISQ